MERKSTTIMDSESGMGALARTGLVGYPRRVQGFGSGADAVLGVAVCG